MQLQLHICITVNRSLLTTLFNKPYLMRIKNILVAAISGLAMLASEVQAASPNASGLVNIRKADAAEGEFFVGFVAGNDGRIIARLKSPPNQLLYVHLPDGTVIDAEMIKRDAPSNLALIQPRTATAAQLPTPYVFANQPAESQRQVSAFDVVEPLTDSKLIDGTLAKIRVGDAQKPTLYSHNALTNPQSAGAPLFNNCGEVVGVIGVKSSGLFAQSKAESAVAIAGDWVIEKLIGADNIKRADEVCLSAAAAIEKTEEEKRALAEELRKSEAEKRAVEEAARQQAEADNQALARADEQAQQSAAEQAQYREYIKWASVIGALLLALLILFAALRRRANLRAKTATQNLATMKQRDEKVAATPEVFIEGGTISERFAIRIPPAQLAKPGGVVIGRNPQQCDFVINHPQMSRQQFNLTHEDGMLMIRDLGSSNGTTVGGRKLTADESTMLADGSNIEINQLNFIVQVGERCANDND